MMQALFNTVFNLRMFSIVRRLYCLSCEPPEIHIVRVLFNGLFNLAHVQHRQEESDLFPCEPAGIAIVWVRLNPLLNPPHV